MSTLIVIATVHAKPGMSEALRPHLQALIAPTLLEHGCMRYELNESEEGGRWMFVEQWASKAHLDAHLKTAHMAHLQAAAEGLIGSIELFTGAQLPAIA